MKDYIEERAVALAGYIIEHKATVRDAALAFNISKSTVHKDLTERLWSIDRKLAGAAKKILEENKANRHIRGGQATKDKYERKRNAS